MDRQYSYTPLPKAKINLQNNIKIYKNVLFKIRVIYNINKKILVTPIFKKIKFILIMKEYVQH